MNLKKREYATSYNRFYVKVGTGIGLTTIDLERRIYTDVELIHKHQNLSLHPSSLLIGNLRYYLSNNISFEAGYYHQFPFSFKAQPINLDTEDISHRLNSKERKIATDAVTIGLNYHFYIQNAYLTDLKGIFLLLRISWS